MGKCNLPKRQLVKGEFMKHRKSLRVLINDDDRAVLEMLKLSVEATGDYRIVLSDCTQKSVEIVKQFKFDLVITDFNTPVMNGMDLIEEIRSFVGINHDTPIILITGDPNDSIKASAESYDDVKFMRKPFKLSDFHNLIKGILKTVYFG